MSPYEPYLRACSKRYVQASSHNCSSSFEIYSHGRYIIQICLFVRAVVNTSLKRDLIMWSMQKGQKLMI